MCSCEREQHIQEQVGVVINTQNRPWQQHHPHVNQRSCSCVETILQGKTTDDDDDTEMTKGRGNDLILLWVEAVRKEQ